MLTTPHPHKAGQHLVARPLAYQQGYTANANLAWDQELLEWVSIARDTRRRRQCRTALAVYATDILAGLDSDSRRRRIECLYAVTLGIGGN